MQRQGALIGGERDVIVSELAVGIPDVVEGFVHVGIELRGLEEPGECRGIAVVRLAQRLVLLLGVVGRGRVGLVAVGFLDLVDTVVIDALGAFLRCLLLTL